MKPPIYWIWLQGALGVGAEQTEDLLRKYGTAQAIFEAQTIDPTGLRPEQYRRLRDKDTSEAAAIYGEVTALGGFVMTPEDDEYTPLFEGMFAPPLVLYGKGERFDVSAYPTIAVVGTRKHDEAGVLVTRRLAAGLAAGGAVIISGGAKGLDAEALNSALDEGGRCISFQACGIDVDYPKATSALRERLLENGGMLLSEFPPGLPAHKHHFRIRNRLISAAGCGTLVTQAPKISGALITASWAREQGRDVFAAPGAVGTPYSEGSNDLLKDGAKLVTGAVDILMDYIERYPLVINVKAAIAAEERATTQYHREQRARRYTKAPVVRDNAPVLKVAQPLETPPEATVIPCPETVGDEAKRIYHALKAQPQTVTELARTLGLSPAAVLANMTMLELHGAVTCGAGQRYALKTQS